MISVGISWKTSLNARENIKMIDGESIDLGVGMAFPYMALKNNLLYQEAKQGEEMIEHLVVPKSYYRMVLDLAHGHIVGGHLGLKRMNKRITQRFFWLGLHWDYCEACPECQYSVPNFRSPLVSLPIIELSFERISMNLVGPVVKAPEAIDTYWWSWTMPHYIRKLYSCVIHQQRLYQRNLYRYLWGGLPKELTDQGTPFITKELCTFFKISHLRTSVYHPQLVKRFNKTLKHMWN